MFSTTTHRSPDDRCDGSHLRVAVPGGEGTVAPLFGSARTLRLWTHGDTGVTELPPVSLDTTIPARRVHLLRDLNVDVLLCNGIERKTQLMCEAWGIRVIRGVVGETEVAVRGFVSGAIPSANRSDKFYDHSLVLYSCDPEEWARSLFTSLGWTVSLAESPADYPIELEASRPCPVCGKDVRVAICTGPRTSQVDRELNEFVRRAGQKAYHARVFVHHRPGVLLDWGRDHGVEMLDPVEVEFSPRHPAGACLPPLHGPVEGHHGLTTLDPREGF